MSLFTLEKSSTVNIALLLTPLQPGDLVITGVEYGMKAQFPQTESTDYTIHGKQRLATAGPRLSTTKEHKTSVVYGADNRLKVRVRPGRPRLSFALEEMPAEDYDGLQKHCYHSSAWCTDCYLGKERNGQTLEYDLGNCGDHQN